MKLHKFKSELVKYLIKRMSKNLAFFSVCLVPASIKSIMDPSIRNNSNNNDDDIMGDLNEAPLLHGDFVVGIARGVGFLVAIVSVLIFILLMTFVKFLISHCIRIFGVFGVLLLVAIISMAVVWFKNASVKAMWTMLSNSCK